MKILFVIPALGNVYGGPSKLILEMAQALGSKGINIDIITTNANGTTVLNVPLNTWIPEKFYRLQYFSYSPLLDYKVSISLTKWLFNHVRDYDLVHTVAIFSYPVLAAHFICQIQQVPYIMNPQGMLEPWALSYKAWKKGFYYKLFEKPALQKASAIQMLSEAEASKVEVLKLVTPKVIIPNGIHRQDFESLPNPDLFYQKFPHTRNKSIILFLGRIDPKKGLDLLATAFAKVKAKFNNTHLIIAGPDNIGFQSTAENYFATSGCSDAVTFTGMLTGSIKYSALAAASVYIAPSYSEGFSISILEGMASGLPCIFTTSCNFPEAGNAKAAYVVDIDTDKITTALTECLNNPEKSKEIGARARQLVFEQYTWEQIAIKLTAVYSRIINKDKEKDSLSSLQSITS